MYAISNAIFVFRLSGAFVAFAAIGFICGYYGPIYLLPDPGVGPITGFLITLPCGAIGAAAAVYGSVKGFSRGRYLGFLALVAAIVVSASVALVILQ